jgi:hypothetical protein
LIALLNAFRGTWQLQFAGPKERCVARPLINGLASSSYSAADQNEPAVVRLACTVLALAKPTAPANDYMQQFEPRVVDKTGNLLSLIRINKRYYANLVRDREL